MKALLIVAHGSRRKEANNEFVALVKKIRKKSKEEYDFVEHAFLELCEPSLFSAAGRMVSQGADQIYVFPFFLNSGNHVARDIPEIVYQLMQNYPECDIRLLPSLGKLEGMENWVIRQIQANVPRELPVS
ncbi:MAG: CbiX/SirB N-terminal domain-containing protein [SAR324 cluster bacterium]|nr:CbiX/SirB N-terminal domain-containing protein [SAR324 cluster bacterium]